MIYGAKETPESHKEEVDRRNLRSTMGVQVHPILNN